MCFIDKKYRWYAVYTKGNHEKRVYEFLKDQNIESYLPLERKLRNWSDRKKWVEIPLFPSYLFVKVSYKEYYNILKHHSVLYYVSFDGKAIPIPEEQLKTIIKILACNYNYELNTENFKKGESVQISFGPFSGHKGEIIKWMGEKRLLFRISNIGYSFILDTSKNHLVHFNRIENQ